MAKERADKEKLRRELYLFTIKPVVNEKTDYQFTRDDPNCDFDETSISRMNPLDENSLTIQTYNSLRKAGEQRQILAASRRYPGQKGTLYISTESMEALSGNELAENEIKNIPTPSKCTTVHKPVSRYN